MNRTDDLKVFISNRDSTCDECHEELGRKAWIFLAGERGHCVWRAPTWITWRSYRRATPR